MQLATCTCPWCVYIMQGFKFTICTFNNITVWVHSVQFSYVISAMLIQPNALPSLLTSILYNFPGNIFLQNELWWDSKLMFTLWQCITAWLHQLLTEKCKTHKPMYLCKTQIACYSFHLHKNSWLQKPFPAEFDCFGRTLTIFVKGPITVSAMTIHLFKKNVLPALISSCRLSLHYPALLHRHHK